MDLEAYFKVHRVVSVHPKSIILGQIANCQFIDLLKFETLPSFLLNFRICHSYAICVHQIKKLIKKLLLQRHYDPSDFGSPTLTRIIIKGPTLDKSVHF